VRGVFGAPRTIIRRTPLSRRVFPCSTDYTSNPLRLASKCITKSWVKNLSCVKFVHLNGIWDASQGFWGALAGESKNQRWRCVSTRAIGQFQADSLTLVSQIEYRHSRSNFKLMLNNSYSAALTLAELGLSYKVFFAGFIRVLCRISSILHVAS
jgi:hypothetical protein